MFITYLDLGLKKIIKVINDVSNTKHTIDSINSIIYMTLGFSKKIVKIYYDCQIENFCTQHNNTTIKILEFQHPLQKNVKTGVQLRTFLAFYDLLSIESKKNGNIEQLKYDLKRHLLFT